MLVTTPAIARARHPELLKMLEQAEKISEKSQFKFINNFQPPCILVDNFEKRKYKSMEIKRIEADDLEKFGLRLVSVPATPQSRTYPRQIKHYMFESKDSPIPKSEILYKIPKDHVIELDTQNNRIRIKGKNAYPYLRNENASRWIELGKKV